MNKFNLKIHLIFVCKYRKKLLVRLGDNVKSIMTSISKNKDYSIVTMGVDKDHIHFIISFKPMVSVTQIVRYLKQQSTYILWKNHSKYLEKHFWREKTFWSDGYFVYTIGEASTSIVENYINSQG